MSRWRVVVRCVPQGSALEPELFYIFLGDTDSEFVCTHQICGWHQVVDVLERRVDAIQRDLDRLDKVGPCEPHGVQQGPGTNTGWAEKGLKAALSWTWGSWLIKNSTWVSNVHLQPSKPTISWVTSKEVFLFKEEEQVVPLCCKMSQQRRRPVWLNRELLLRLWERKTSLEEGSGNLGRAQGCL